MLVSPNGDVSVCSVLVYSRTVALLAVLTCTPTYGHQANLFWATDVIAV